MTGKIQVLPDAIAKSIAAGEVVERPASVVKELMENAIDAKSSEIVVDVKAGGLQLVRVQDNGEGIDREDVPIALQRYATSKIRSAEDLFNIRSLGFRGEALPSIASVSHMTLRTRVPDSLSGTRVVCEGGEIKEISEVGCPIGTEVEVKNLFFNIPVKRKFLKSIRSELRQVLNQFLRLSLAHPRISFRLNHDGRVLQELPGTESLAVRMEAILGREVYDHLQRIEFEDGETNISGFASLPSVLRGSADGIYLYVNDRFVRDRVVHKAILEAYRHVIPAGKFPVVVLKLTVPPHAVDVNVHPTKAEVKFRDPDRVFRAVREALLSLQGRGAFPPESRVCQELREPVSYREPLSLPRLSFLPPPPWDGGTVTRVGELAPPEWEVNRGAALRIVGQLYETYLICETEQGLIFIDQHAAHERLLFEQFKRQHEARSIPGVKFLVPPLIELSAEESFLMESSLDEFLSAGFEIDPAGQRAYAIRSMPSLFEGMAPEAIIREILQEISFLNREGKGTDALHPLLISTACRAAVRGRSRLRREEIEELLGKLASFDLSATCPHGRPIFFFLSREDLNKQFRRNR
jgi:DNA mismatch repair protein MutL